jgi:hypothetical protein
MCMFSDNLNAVAYFTRGFEPTRLAVGQAVAQNQRVGFWGAGRRSRKYSHGVFLPPPCFQLRCVYDTAGRKSEGGRVCRRGDRGSAATFSLLAHGPRTWTVSAGSERCFTLKQPVGDNALIPWARICIFGGWSIYRQEGWMSSRFRGLEQKITEGTKRPEFW